MKDNFYPYEIPYSWITCLKIFLLQKNKYIYIFCNKTQNCRKKRSYGIDWGATNKQVAYLFKSWPRKKRSTCAMKSNSFDSKPVIVAKEQNFFYILICIDGFLYILGNWRHCQFTWFICVTGTKSIEMETTDPLITSHTIPERYEIDRSPRVSNEITDGGTEQANNAMNIKTAIRILFVFF